MDRKILVEVPDEGYWRRQIRCQAACPVQTDARGYVRAIAAGAVEAAFQGKQGAVLWSVSADDGKKLAEYKLESAPVFDGMIAARNRIYISLQDGSIVCFGK